MADFNAGIVIGIIIFVILVVAFTPVIGDLIANAGNQYVCKDPEYTIQSTDLLLCTNSTVCPITAYPVYNATFNLCTNASGVSVVNRSVGGFNAYNETSTYVGINTTETVLLGLIILLIVIGGVFGFVRASGLQ